MATIRFDTDKIHLDMAEKGWIATDLARAADVSNMTISRFFSGGTQSARTAGKIARALGYTVRRYLLREKVA